MHLLIVAAASSPSLTFNLPSGRWALAIALIGGLGGFAGLGALLKSRAERSKLAADASKVIADAATTLVAPLQSEVSRLTGRVAVLESDQHIQRMLLVDHSVWDHIALEKLLAAGVQMPTMPPLFTPTRIAATTEPAGN